MATDTTFFFMPGKMGTLLSSSAGSTGKGKLGAYLVKNNRGPLPFVCNTFSSQASHTVVEEDGTEHVYKHLNSCAHLPGHYSKMYIGQGAAITLSVLLKEIKQYQMTPQKLGIHPLCAIIQGIDVRYETGEGGFDGETGNGRIIKSGSTCSGVGTALARKLMRRPNVKLAKDCPELEDYLCQVELEIMDRLDAGEPGLLEIAQGFQLSLGLEDMYPYVTSRNSTVAGGLNDMMIPPKYAGNTFIDERAFPIRIHDHKYVLTEDVLVERVTSSHLASAVDELTAKYHPSHFRFAFDKDQYNKGVHPEHYHPDQHQGEVDLGGDVEVWRLKGSHLYWEEVNSPKFKGKFEVVSSPSGHGWPDQSELTWEEVAKYAGAPEGLDITSYTTLTKLPRKVYELSRMGLDAAIRYNQPPDGYRTYVSLNFANYVDWQVTGSRSIHDITDKIHQFVDKYLAGLDAELALLGTGAKTDEFINLISFSPKPQ